MTGSVRSARHPVTVDRGVMMPARDGIRLCTDVYRPVTDQAPAAFPTLVMRTPYGKDSMGSRYGAAELAAAGHSVVIQELRGTVGSEGTYSGCEPRRGHPDEADDGHDCIEWAAAQPWSTGRVGMFGPSMMGATQWAAAQAAPEHLVAIAPEVIAWDSGHRSAFALETLGMFGLTMARIELMHRRDEMDPDEFGARRADLDAAIADPDQVLCRLPLSDQPLLRGLADFFFDRLAEGPSLAPHDIDHSRIRVPAFIITGWFDFTLSGTLNQFWRMRSQAGTETARAGTRLFVGNYYHGVHGSEPADRPPGWLPVAGGAALRTAHSRPHWLAWMTPYLRGQTGVAEAPVARVYTMCGDGLDTGTWQDLDAFPPDDVIPTDWYLRSTGCAGAEPGTLTRTADGAGATPDSFRYNPLDPVRTPGGARGGVFDQREVLARDDVLVYRSAALADAVEVTGVVTLSVIVATDVFDTDISALLLDIHPDGVAQNVADNLLRLRYRDGADERLLEPGREYTVTIDLVATSTRFDVGHRIGLAITGSNFPQWDRNPNTGEPLHSSADTRVATTTVFHDRTRPSHLTLPIRGAR